MTTPRDLPTVISNMLSFIPESETELRSALENKQSSAIFAAPENATLWWRETADLLATWPWPTDQLPWMVSIADVFSGRVFPLTLPDGSPNLAGLDSLLRSKAQIAAVTEQLEEETKGP